MAHTLEIRNRATYLHILVEGDNTAKDVAGYLAEIREKCIELHCPTVLIEENLAGPSLGLFAVYEIVAKISMGLASIIRQVAYVDINPEHKKEVNQFAETTAVNRGINIKLFQTVREAEKWLAETILLQPGGLAPENRPDNREQA